MKAKISVSLVKNLKPSDKPYEVADTALKGFLARVQPTGAVSYYFAYRVSDGTRKRYRIGSHPTITAIVARDAAEEAAAKIVMGGDPHQAKKSARTKKKQSEYETLTGFIDHKYKGWALAHQKRGQETLTLLESSFKDLFPKQLVEITAWDVQKLRSKLTKSGLKPSTINRRVTTLKAVLNKAVEWKVIQSNPLQEIKPIKLDSSSRIRYLSNEEERRLRAALDDREAKLRRARDSGNEWRETRDYKKMKSIDSVFADYLKPMVLLALNTGLRRGEVFNLLWTDVDFKKKELIVEGTTAKSGQTRHVQLNSQALQTLQDWNKQSNADYVFPSPRSGKRFNNIKKSWEGLRSHAGLEDFRFHDLRHSFASKLVMAKVDLYTVKELMGHSTIQMTEKYAHLAPEHKASAVEKIVS
tara:strand:+ start:175 stop:1413 length:1239 start_codon:yes stop_codon:yes gene_type:complete